MGLKNTKFDGVYSSVSADGMIRVKADKETPGAKYREYETSDGTKGSKYELEYSELSGKIIGLEFFDGDYGKVLQVKVKDGDEVIVLCLTVSSNFCEDFMKKLPNVDLSKEVTIKPYSFEDKITKKLKKGVTIIQGEEKAANFFIKDLGDNKYGLTNGYPAPEKDKTYDKEDWKIYFMQARKFLVNYITENIIPKINEVEKIDITYGEEVSVDDINF